MKTIKAIVPGAQAYPPARVHKNQLDFGWVTIANRDKRAIDRSRNFVVSVVTMKLLLLSFVFITVRSNVVHGCQCTEHGASRLSEFFLVLNPDNKAPDEDDAPYPRTFYPNPADESGAEKIVVTEGAKLKNLILRVGTAWKPRTVSGIVVWQNGRPVGDAHISLYEGNRYTRAIEVDKKGRFSFEVFGDFKYAIEASRLGG